MSRAGARTPVPSERLAALGPTFNGLLGMALVVAAGLNILLLAAIGWAAWERATLSARWLELCRALPEGRRQAVELLGLTGAERQSIATSVSALPDDLQVARFIGDLEAHAAAYAVAIDEIAPQTAPGGSTLWRYFQLRAQGSPSQLLSFLAHMVAIAPSGARFDEVVLQAEGDPAMLSVRLLFAVRPGGP